MTLAMLGVATGVADIVSNGLTIYNFPPGFLEIGRGGVGEFDSSDLHQRRRRHPAAPLAATHAHRAHVLRGGEQRQRRGSDRDLGMASQGSSRSW